MSSRSSVLFWGQAVACTLVTVLGVAACGGSDATGSGSSSTPAQLVEQLVGRVESSSGGATSSSSGSSGNPTDAGADADASPDGSSGRC